MTLLSRMLRLFAIAFACAASPGAWATLACTITASPATVSGIYAAASNLDVQGAFTVTCTIAPGDPGKNNLWIGIDQTTAGLTMTRDVGGSTLNWFVYRVAAGNSVWLNTGVLKSNQSGNSGLQFPMNFGRGVTTMSTNVPFYFRVPLGQNSAAGIYLAAGVVVTLRNTNDTGTLLDTTSLGARVSIQNDCRFSNPPVPISLAYTAFSAAAVPGSANFGVTCTQGTTYTLSLDRTRSVIPGVNLAYSLGLSASTSTGTALEQGYTLNVSVDAGQAGSCGAPPCQGTDTRTITVTY